MEARLSFKQGPLHKVQFVVEFVGPRTMPAAAAVQLLLQNWYMALGQPQIFAMRASDLGWQPLAPTTDGAYDSLALAWDFLTPNGKLSATSAKNLVRVAEQFAPAVSRRVMSMPPATDVDRVVRNLEHTKDSLDVGFALSVVSQTGGFAERDLWVECARLGLQFQNGGFDWTPVDHPRPLLSVTPFGITDAFSLRNVQANGRHPGVTVGFHLPGSALPVHGLEGCFKVADHLARTLNGVILDEEDRLLTDKTREHLKGELRQAMSLFSHAGMTVGSQEVLRLFGEL